MISPDPPLPNSYWVYPGQLLAGEYPGSPRGESAQRNRVQRLLTAGINYFVDLTMPDELPPYAPDLPPRVQHVRLPIFDHDIPTKPEQMVEILRAIKGALNEDKRVYVHCRAGIGRTGTVIGCLLSDSGVSGDDALHELNRMWQQCARARSWTAVPETDEQVEYVRRWNRQLYPAIPGALPATAKRGRGASGGGGRGAPIGGAGVGREASPAGLTMGQGGGSVATHGGVRGAPASGGAANAPGTAAGPGGARGRSGLDAGSPAEGASRIPTGTGGRAANSTGVSSTGVFADPRGSSAATIGGFGASGAASAAAVVEPSAVEAAEAAAYVHTPGVVQEPAKATRDRYLGALIGLAVGDALGAIHQQEAPGSFEPISDLTGGGVLDLPRGAWTDDTAMALCLAESLLESRGFDARDQVERYAKWQQSGYLSSTGEAVGITPNTARSIAMAQWRRQLFAGSHDPKLVEPSPLSRMAPPVMFYLLFKEQALEFAGDAVRTTCQAPLVLNVCRLFAAMLHGALNGQPKPQVLAPPWDLPPDRPKSRIRGLIEGRYRIKDPASLHAGDHILDTLEIALWAFERTDSFADGALLVANAGENSDVAGAVYGQLAGAYYGVEAIPAAWRNALMKKDLIESLALRLWDQTKVGLDH